jgi:hypothetical protein
MSPTTDAAHGVIARAPLTDSPAKGTDAPILARVNGLEQSFEELVERVVRRVVGGELDRRTQATEPRWFTVAEYAESRQLAPCTVRGAIKNGRLAAERYGRVWRIRYDAAIAHAVPVVRDTATARVDELLARPRRRRGRPGAP